MRAPLDQDTTARRTSDGREHGRRSADDQRAWRGHDHHRHGPVKSIREFFPHEKERHHKDERREGDHASCVVLFRLLKKPLRAGLLGLRLLDELDHARECGVLCALADGKF